jgi:membrane-associated protein
MNLIHSILTFISPAYIISSLGLVGVIAVVFAESGLFFGFFLPGDSLLFTAGFLASQSILPLVPLMIGSFIAAVVGDSVGYSFGKSVGQALYSRPDSRWFKQKHIEQARNFYEKHGPKAIVLARFIPIVRTFAPIVAGAANMNYRKFLSFNIIGGFIWSFGLIGLGYFFGNIIPNPDKYITPVVILIILTSFLPGIIHLVKMQILKRRNM